MKYFELSLDKENYSNAAQLINWYGVQDVRLIKWETYHKLKKRVVYQVDPSEELVFPDIISFPFLLLSPMVKEVIRMYGDQVAWKNVILLDTKNRQESAYCLPIMEERNDIEVLDNDELQKVVGMDKCPDWIANRNICWITSKGKRHTIINLDLAESLLRRNAVGLSLKEVRFREKSDQGRENIPERSGQWNAWRK